MVYLASAAPLPLVPFDPQNPVLVVRELTSADKVYSAVQNITQQPYLYQAGSYQGCGCGFIYDPGDELTTRSLARLQDYLNQHQTKQLWLYSCWAGEEGLPIETQLTLSTDQISATLPLDNMERQLIYISG